MSTIIINEFELVPKPAGDAGTMQDGTGESGAEAAATTPAPGVSRVQETQRLIRRQSERLLRVWAH